MGARTKARKRALDVLFEADQRGIDPVRLLADRIAEPGTESALPQYSVDLVEGVIAEAPRGTAGFGYDPVFVPLGEGTDGRTFAELTADEKAAVSHRGRAFRALLAALGSPPPCRAGVSATGELGPAPRGGRTAARR